MTKKQLERLREDVKDKQQAANLGLIIKDKRDVEIARLREVLRFYSAEENYEWKVAADKYREDYPDALNDRGERARKALGE